MKVVLGKAEQTGETPKVDSKTLGRFLEEAQVTGQLDHPGIVPVHELGLDSEGQVYFTMKLVKGQDLKAIFDLVHEGKEGWTQTKALGVLLKVCEAMAFAHDKRVIHRDLKPANVMVGKFGEVYVMDWGLARVEGREDRRDLRMQSDSITSRSVHTDRREAKEADLDSPLVTMDGTVVGTPYYMPPEQAAGEGEKIDARSDVYAVGAMLYHVLTGQMPYHTSGQRPSPHTVLAMVLQGPPQSVHQMNPKCSAELEAICEKAMARQRENRYADMGELADDLRAFMEDRVVRAHRTGALVEFRKWVKRNRSLAATIAA